MGPFRSAPGGAGMSRKGARALLGSRRSCDPRIASASHTERTQKLARFLALY